ncbi:Modulator of FtsH protease HflK [Fundidesulfovibrio magnetotacticus]|uniref:Modulator of FtsH protease HflK n=1 Tax=Fundidesulfovibrio magnetotacticus TaxID=2730080 RepID=A0A6V8LYD8_9BACT|nr:stomatin-like protein [Fundidesulfovibrio magnetotacticus]GFK94667.1 Modulator of FtsH protease HflK [Fundidesulfovibrio magnetotacticus]
MLVVTISLAVFVVVLLALSVTIVPQQSAYIVERLGKYNRSLEAGFHVLLPVLDRVSYKFSLKEEVVDTPSQPCITKDNVTVHVDGLCYIKVNDPRLAAYGISNYRVAATQLAQTSLRSAIGKITLDKTFEEREVINSEVVKAVDEAAMGWGVKVMRFEIKDIAPPESVKKAMEAQMTAEREKRAQIALAEGQKQAAINISEGQMQQAINLSEGDKQRQINEAEGRSRQIELVGAATAQALRQVAEALNGEGGLTAANLRVTEQYVEAFGKLARESTALIVPQNVADVAGLVATAMQTVKKTG